MDRRTASHAIRPLDMNLAHSICRHTARDRSLIEPHLLNHLTQSSLQSLWYQRYEISLLRACSAWRPSRKQARKQARKVGNAGTVEPRIVGRRQTPTRRLYKTTTNDLDHSYEIETHPWCR